MHDGMVRPRVHTGLQPLDMPLPAAGAALSALVARRDFHAGEIIASIPLKCVSLGERSAYSRAPRRTGLRATSAVGEWQQGPLGRC